MHKFQNIVGHDNVKTYLSSQLGTGNFHHAYLFAGPEHVGKMSLVREFMSQIRTGASSDQRSPLAHQLELGQGPGLIGFPDNGESLKVEQIRSIIDLASKRTAESEHSFCIIDHAERLTEGAANALLKILEEPPPRFIFLLTARSSASLLPTLLSRVQIFRCDPLPDSVMGDYIRKKLPSENAARELTALSLGRIGLAVQMLENDELKEHLRELFTAASQIRDRDLIDRFKFAEKLTHKDTDPKDLEYFLLYLATHLRRNGARSELSALENVQRTTRLLRETNVNKRLWMENLLLGIFK